MNSSPSAIISKSQGRYPISARVSALPKHGLLGLAYAQAIQAAAILVITWLLLRKRVPALPIVPYRWNRALFSELASYGLYFQFVTVSQSLREPVTKLLIAKFGGLGLTGLYEMAARAVITLREVIVQANQVLVPTISRLKERDPASIPAVYRESYRLVFFLAFPAFALLTALSPLISRIWIGRYEAAFVEFVAILSAGWLVNVLSNPSYVVDLGTGALRWVSIGCVTTAILNAILGSLAGYLSGGIAVAGACAFSLACGYCIIVVAYHLKNHAPFIHLLPRESVAILVTSVAGAMIVYRFSAAAGGFAFLHRCDGGNCRGSYYHRSHPDVDPPNAQARVAARIFADVGMIEKTPNSAAPSLVLWESATEAPIAAKIAIAGDFLPAGALAIPATGWQGAATALASHFEEIAVSFVNLECSLQTETLTPRKLCGLGQIVSAPRPLSTTSTKSAPASSASPITTPTITGTRA